MTNPVYFIQTGKTNRLHHHIKILMRTSTCILCLAFMQSGHAQLAIPQNGFQITRSVKFAPGTYRLNNGAAPVIEIEGNNLVVDFNHAVLDGNTTGVLPDAFTGIAVSIKSGQNITIKNLTVKGYKVALMAKGISGLVIENCDLSYNYRQHLNSTQQKEDLSDWMSYHHNENDEWLRYGAAIYLRGCNKAAVHDNKVTGGQCALMLTQCDSGMIYNNDFSFNSGIGIGMYRSSTDSIMYNRLNFNVRGHSEGVYNRGQDAAAILVFEQCNNNVFAFNSATHSGDGFFLWAGQTTMDSGAGGCNGNFIFANNFSYAPTNGIEVTFSSNRISQNAMFGCDNGIWGGYSYHTDFVANTIDSCNNGIAIEHGQDNHITFNRITNSKTAIKLWARPSQPPDWGYAKRKDTRSCNYQLSYNQFWQNKVVMDVLRTANISGEMNDTLNNTVFQKSDSIIKIGVPGFRHVDERLYAAGNQREIEISHFRKPWKTELKNTDLKLLGRRQIRMTEWGPYDFRSPLIWNTNPVSTSDTMQFDIIGPAGKWKIIRQRGVKNISAITGTLPGHISAIKTNEKGEDIFIELEYKGEAVTTVLGNHIDKGKPCQFNYRNSLLPVNWQVSWFGFDSLHNPVTNPSSLQDILHQPPLLTEQTSDLHYAWWNGVGKERKQEQFVTVAEANVDLPDGEYVLGVSWEDVIRIYVDGQLILDEWKPLAHMYDESPHRELPLHMAGKQRLRIEHANQGGFATLIIKLKKK